MGGGPSRGVSPDLGAILHGYWGSAVRDIGRARRRFVRSESFCRHSRDQASAFEWDDRLGEPSDGEDSLSLPTRTRPLRALLSDTSSSSDSSAVISKMPEFGGHARIDWAPHGQG